MKAIIALLIFVTFLKHSLACSEMGRKEFNLPINTANACGKMAQNYAIKFAKSIVEQEKMQKNYFGPNDNFKISAPLPTLYLTTSRIGNSKLIGYNVGLDTSNKWQCNFCVQMSLDEKNNCRLESISKHMCAH